MEFQFQDIKQGFTSPDFLYNFEPAGDLAPKYKAPPAPNSVENLTFEYINKQRQVADAVAQQHRIDNIYERVMNEAPRRDVEVLPPENPAEAFNPNKTRMKNITPVEQQQEISELLERQVKRPSTPSSATPPVTNTPKTYPLYDPLETPPNYTPRQPIGGPNPSPTAKPTGLPVSAGRLGLKAIGTAAEFGFRLAAGQSVEQAAVGVAGGAVGSYVGAAVGSVVGPVGTFVGGMAGGYIGGAIADLIFDQANPSPANIPINPTSGPSKWKGGYLYNQSYAAIFSSDSAERIQYFKNGNNDSSVGVPGRVIDVKLTGRYNGGYDNAAFSYYEVTSIDAAGNISVRGIAGGGTVSRGTDTIYPAFVGFVLVNQNNTNITDYDPPPQAIPSDNRTLESIYHPGNENYTPPPAYPEARKNPLPNNYAPGGFTANGSPRGDAPSWIPHAFPAPKQTPNPNTTPSNLGSNFPGTSPNLAPSPNPNSPPNPSGSPSLSSSPSPSSSPSLNSSPSPPPSYRLEGPSGKPTGSPSSNPSTLSPPNAVPNGLPNLTPQPIPSDGFKPSPQPEPTPQETDICDSPCIKSMGKKIEENSIFWIDIQVPIISCEFKNEVWSPTTNNKIVKVLATQTGNEISKTQSQFEELAKINQELCLAKNKDESDCYAVVPEWWQVRTFQKPQLIIQYAELLDNGKLGRSRWSTAIPHYDKPKDYKPVFPQYDKGDVEGILVLNDNSKVIINAKNKTECLRVINSFKQFINPDRLKNIPPPKIGGERPTVYRKVHVVPVYCHFFPTGQKNTVPEWSKKLREKNESTRT